MRTSSFTLLCLICAGFHTEVTRAFLPSKTIHIYHSKGKILPSLSPFTSSPLYMANAFDVSKPVFDLLTLREIRGDALLRYATLNQSEPLRINLFAALTLTCWSAPWITESIGIDHFTLAQLFISIASGSAAAFAFIKECGKRSKQLNRMEKELNAEYLTLRLPTNALSDSPFGTPQTFGELRASNNPPRIIALCGSKDQIKQTLASLTIYGRRLKQASTFVVPVPTDWSTIKDWGLDTNNNKQPWLADAYDTSLWLEYFDGLSEEQSSDTHLLRWFGLNSNGRSFASGIGDAPLWLQVLGQYLRPTVILDQDDANLVTGEDTNDILKAQQSFYTALTTGQLDQMSAIFSSTQAVQVTEVVDAGGRLDAWNSCLEDGARPAGMVISGRDATLVSETEAWSTAIEFPASLDTATLLAVQQWVRASPNTPWTLLLHQTIPWTVDNKAQGLLRCDCRGCVALTRSVERRTFGGLIG